MMNDIQQVIVKTLLAVQRVIINDRHCFELYGFDIMLDSNLKPWLLEVNACPSMSADTEADYELKFGVLEDTFHLAVDLDNK